MIGYNRGFHIIAFFPKPIQIEQQRRSNLFQIDWGRYWEGYVGQLPGFRPDKTDLEAIVCLGFNS